MHALGTKKPPRWKLCLYLCDYMHTPGTTMHTLLHMKVESTIMQTVIHIIIIHILDTCASTQNKMACVSV